MLFGKVASGLLLSTFTTALPSLKPRQAASRLPLSTKGRDILDANGNIFQFASTNWPGHQELMIPEGLQHSSVRDIVAWFPKLGLNSVRLTFAIEMVDDYYSNNPNQTLEKTVMNVLGETNGTIVLDQILEKNPGFTKEMTRLDVWDAIAEEFAAQNVIIHLDNHVSKAFWCCSENDGNGWFGEDYFDVDNWKRGLAFMAKHASLPAYPELSNTDMIQAGENWPTFSSIGLRNELRQASGAEPVDWYTWYVHMTAAADAVHEANSDALIFFSGLSYDTYIDPIPLGKTLNGTSGTATEGKSAVFVPDEFAFKEKIVLEIHKYDYEETQDDCETFKSKWYQQGFQAVNPDDPATKYAFPMVISEWGFKMDDVYWNQTTYAKCLIEMVRDYQVGFQHWALGGSFYLQTRPGRDPLVIVGLEEFWGILNYNWTAIRSPVSIENSLSKMVEVLEAGQ